MEDGLCSSADISETDASLAEGESCRNAENKKVGSKNKIVKKVKNFIIYDFPRTFFQKDLNSYYPVNFLRIKFKKNS